MKIETLYPRKTVNNIHLIYSLASPDSESSNESMEDEKSIGEELSYPILMADRVRHAAGQAESFKVEASEVAKQVDRIAQMLRTMVRLTIGAQQPIYERPIRRVIAEVNRNLERSLALVRKCKRRSILLRVVTITNAADFRKLINHLDASIGDVKWVISVYYAENGNGGGGGGGIVISLPPIASNDPILSWIWSFIAAAHMGRLPERIEAANELASLAIDNERNKKIIVEEFGVSPLLKLLKESSSPEAQIAAATALYHLATNEDGVRAIVEELGVLVVVHVLGDAPMAVQISIANLVARMAKQSTVAQEDFARANAIRPLVTLLSIETITDEPRTLLGKPNIHSIVEINKQMGKNLFLSSKNYRAFPESSSNLYHESGRTTNFVRTGQNRRSRENEKPELKSQLRISCARAIWMIVKGSLSNSKKLAETKGLLVLAKLVEKETGELHLNCLMAIKEITAAAEFNTDLRHSAFKWNSPAAKAIVDQLLRVIEESEDSTLRLLAIKSIGSLARTFPARETRVIRPLVTLFDSSNNEDVAMEAIIALQKFSCPDNFLCKQHSITIVEFGGVVPLMKLMRLNAKTQLQGLILLCYLSMLASNNAALEQARVLTAIEGADRTLVAQHPELKELLNKAIYHLNLYDTKGDYSQRLLFMP